MKNKRYEETEEEGASTREAVRKSTRIAARGQRIDYSEVPRYDLPTDWAQPYGKAEGVAIAKSRTPGAGYGLYGIKPRTRNSMLFKEAGEFVCVYATKADLITCSEAQTSDSDCIWTTSRQFQADWDPDALYFDPSLNIFFGKNLAFSYQNNRKTSSINACGLMAKKTHTHTQVKSPPSDPCAFYQT